MLNPVIIPINRGSQKDAWLQGSYQLGWCHNPLIKR